MIINRHEITRKFLLNFLDYSLSCSFCSLEEKLTAVAVGKGIIYVGSSAGTLRQVAVEAGRMSVGDDELTSLPCHLILAK